MWEGKKYAQAFLDLPIFFVIFWYDFFKNQNLNKQRRLVDVENRPIYVGCDQKRRKDD